MGSTIESRLILEGSTHNRYNVLRKPLKVDSNEGNYRYSPSHSFPRPFLEGWLRVGILASGLLCEEVSQSKHGKHSLYSPKQTNVKNVYTGEGLQMEICLTYDSVLCSGFLDIFSTYCNEKKTEILRQTRHESVNQIYFLKAC